MGQPTIEAVSEADELVPDEIADEVSGELLDEELLVEEVSIDGMCGVY